LTIPNIVVPIEPTPLPPADARNATASSGSPCENTARIKDLGFTASKHIKIYGERYTLVSDPFEDGDCTSVQVVSENDRTPRTLRLPAAVLVGLSDRFRKSSVDLGTKPAVSVGVDARLPDGSDLAGVSNSDQPKPKI
jgi:hypothetical protein